MAYIIILCEGFQNFMHSIILNLLHKYTNIDFTKLHIMQSGLNFAKKM